ncbi:hypothetical protein [Paenibacillus xylanivorans]|uniref:hypothetical protein n=1 Tax=Paenibacillus xylanivorans TaxID=1705561 RepID=UPI001364C96B|nr:hypothetical protein [Paenibacillus xylanivorans]
MMMQFVNAAMKAVWDIGNVLTMRHPVQLEMKKVAGKKSAWVVRYAARERNI